MTTSGVLVMRHPFRLTEIGRSLKTGELFRHFPQARHGSYEFTSALDRVARIYAFAQAGNLPFVVLVGSSKARVFGPWWRKAISLILMISGLSALVAALGLSLNRELRRRGVVEAQLAAAASTDALTRLGNRRAFEEESQRAWARAMRYRETIAILIIDVDCFKQFNDHHGHVAGDEALSAVAACIRANVKRPDDVCARYGGEEFAVILPRTSLENAKLVAESIRQSVLATRVGHEAVTVSIGATATIPQPGAAFTSALARADEALYPREGRRPQSRRDERAAARSGDRRLSDAPDRPIKSSRMLETRRDQSRST